MGVHKRWFYPFQVKKMSRFTSYALRQSRCRYALVPVDINPSPLRVSEDLLLLYQGPSYYLVMHRYHLIFKACRLVIILYRKFFNPSILVMNPYHSISKPYHSTITISLNIQTILPSTESLSLNF